MADFNQINQFGSAKPARSGEGMSCAECEAMLTDAIDGTLSGKDRIAFDRHIASCKECSQMLSDTQRGAALLEMLKSPRPEPSALLLDRILARTSGQTGAKASAPASLWSGVQMSIQSGMQSGGTAVVGQSLQVLDSPAAGLRGAILPPDSAGASVLPASAGGSVIPFRNAKPGRFSLRAITHTMMQPRLAMTAAMAFFSIALTLNLTGVHLNELKASDLKPSNLKHSLYQADASLVRYYENLRVVYELESRLSDLKQSGESDNQPARKPAGDSSDDSKSGKSDGGQQKKAPKPGSGTSQRHNPSQQEFKLAVRHLDLPGRISVIPQPEMAWSRSPEPGNTNKSKEEGGPV